MGRSVLTPQQAAALDARSLSVALDAGAGCGKTLVLANRLLGEIAPPEGRDLSRIVGLTFTNKAARELRQRVRTFGRDAWRDAPTPDLRDAWSRIVRDLEAAPISTFHVFCTGLLRRFNVQAALDPGFSLLEGPIGGRRRDEAIEAMLREALADGDVDVRTLAIEQGLGFLTSSLAELLQAQEFEDLAEITPSDDAKMLGRWHELWRTRVTGPACSERSPRRRRRCGNSFSNMTGPKIPCSEAVGPFSWRRSLGS